MTLVAIGLAAFGMGRPALRQLRPALNDRLAVAVWSLALGLLIAGLLFLLLGYVGWLYPEAVVAVSLAALFWALVEFLCVYLGWINGRILNIEHPPLVSQRVADLPGPIKVAGALAAVVLLATLVAALAPPTSAEALSHSLAVPKDSLLRHAIGTIHSTNTLSFAGPRINLVQMWFLWALALDGPVAANLVHWGLGLLVVLAAVLLARSLFGRESAVLAGCLVLLCPGVHWQMTVPLEDLGLALFTTLALTAVCHLFDRREHGVWPWLGGLALGGAVAAKPAGLLFAAALAIAWIFGCWSKGEDGRRQLKAGCRLALVAALVAGPWILPYGLFPESLERQSIGSALRHLGPLLLIALLGLAFARPARGLNVVALVFCAYVALAVSGPASGRWWSAVVPLASVLGAWVWQEADRLPRGHRWIINASAAVVVAMGLVPCGQAAIEASAVACGWQTRDQFLLSRVPTYRASSLLNQISHQGQDLLCQDSRTFYFTCPATSRLGSRQVQPADLVSGGEQQWVSVARASGYSYLLVAQGIEPDSTAAQQQGAGGLSSVPSHARREESSAIGEVIPILEYRFADDNNRYTRYRLLKIR